jgi:two-component system, NtrC family, nitrogen regulation response regulator GlnG
LVHGETGVGKDVVAQEIHRRSARAAGPFEVCDCTALTLSLADSELFGHARGSFTGAHAAHRGAFQRAHGGTLFLDEVGELPLELQPKFLRALETRKIKPVGGTEATEVDVRIIAATNRDLPEEVRRGRFRQDLLFRLTSVTLEVPPLRERREDIPALLQALLQGMGQAALPLTQSTIELFTTGYDWPGNVRELKGALTRVLTFGSVPAPLAEATAQPTSSNAPVDIGEPFQEAKRRVVDAFERDYLRAMLEAADQNISQAARSAAVERNYFRRLLRKHGLWSADRDEEP